MARRGFELALLCCLFSCSSALAADQSADPPGPVVAAAPPATAEAPAPALTATPAPPSTSGSMIPAGTLLVVELTEPLGSSSSKAGDHFGLRLAEPIEIGGSVVVPAGVMGQGEVIDAKPAGIGGRPGRLVLAARYLESGGLRLNLQSFKLGGGGRDNSSLAVGATIAVGLVGVLVPGGGVEYPAGTRATAKIASDVTAPPSTPPAAPSTVPTS